MKAYAKLTAEERREEYARLQKEFEALKAQGLSLNMARGKPGKEQLDLVSDILQLMQKPEESPRPGGSLRTFWDAGRNRFLWAATQVFS